jgi:hypothetical protein
MEAFEKHRKERGSMMEWHPDALNRIQQRGSTQSRGDENFDAADWKTKTRVSQPIRQAKDVIPLFIIARICGNVKVGSGHRLVRINFAGLLVYEIPTWLTGKRMPAHLIPREDCSQVGKYMDQAPEKTGLGDSRVPAPKFLLRTAGLAQNLRPVNQDAKSAWCAMAEPSVGRDGIWLGSR